jgi:aubergine-like protein
MRHFPFLQLDEIDFNSSPLDTFQLADGQKISYVDYYKQHHKLDITDTKQPLLVNMVTRKYLISSISSKALNFHHFSRY